MINITINYSIEGGVELGKNTNISAITIPINKNLDKYDFNNEIIIYLRVYSVIKNIA